MSQIWIRIDKISDTDGIVADRNYVPDDPIYGVSAERRSTGVFVDSIPDAPSIIPGQGLALHINPTTLEMSWVIIEGEKTQEQIIAELQQHAADTDYILMINNLIQ